MKTMTCKQLGGPCNKEFQANTFEEMIAQSKAHGMEMFQKGDDAHVKVMNEMKASIATKTPQDMAQWFDMIKQRFNDTRND